MEYNYVVGFMFNNELDRVLLIRKKRPDWQKGKLNGIGGNIKLKEQPIDAMVREFMEESGIQTERKNWTFIAYLYGLDKDEDFFNLHVFASIGDIEKFINGTDEECKIVNKEDINKLNVILNLTWLIPLSEYKLMTGEPLSVNIEYGI